MKLISLKDNPEKENDFFHLAQSILHDEYKAYALKPEYVSKILKLNFGVPSEAFLIQGDDGEIVGRILLQGSVLHKTLGHFGLFCISSEHQESFQSVWPELEKWFKAQGIKKIIGPYLYTTFFPYRFRIDKLPEKFGWEPNQPDYEVEIFRNLGFSQDQSYFTNFIDGLGVFETKGTTELEEITKSGFKMRPISKERLEDDVKIIYDLSMKGFTENYLFAPIPYELFRSIYVPSFHAVDLSLSCIQENPEGHPIGFNFTFILDEQIIIKSVCVDPAYRGKGILNAGIRWSMVQARKLFPEIRKVATALIHEDNGPSKHVANLTIDRKRHEYILMCKDIE